MREKRGQLFNGRRLGLETPPEDVQETLTNILRKEFEEIISTDRETNSEIFNTIFNSPLELEEALELEAEILAEEGLLFNFFKKILCTKCSALLRKLNFFLYFLFHLENLEFLDFLFHLKIILYFKILL